MHRPHGSERHEDVYQGWLTTTDDWYPCYDGHKVEVRIMFHHLRNDHPTYKDLFRARISIWGADDTGMARDTYHEKKDIEKVRSDLLEEIQTIPEPVTFRQLLLLGFNWD